MLQVVLPPDAPGLDARHVPQVPDVEQDGVVLLQVVPLPRDVGRQLLAGAGQPNQDALSIGGIRLLWLLDEGSEDDPAGEGHTLTQGVLLGDALWDVRALLVDATHGQLVDVVLK